MKKCSGINGCGKVKPLEEFGKYSRGKDGHTVMCKECKSAYDRKYYKTKEGRKEQITSNRKQASEVSKDYIINHLVNNPCVDCGEDDPFFLEFDHQRDKKYNISRMSTLCIDTIQKEIDKCEVRCVRCHLIKTAKDFGWYDKYYERINRVKEATVGNAPTFDHYK